MIICGIDGCELDLVRTHLPASTLWCSVHGHVLDVPRVLPVQSIVHLNYGGGRGEWVRL